MAKEQSGKIDINKAGVEELATLRMVGKTRAQDIVNYRNQHGPFKSCDDLKKIPSFSDKMIEDLKNSGVTCQ